MPFLCKIKSENNSSSPMIFFLAIAILAILAFSFQADGKSLSKEDVTVAIVVVVGTIALLAIGKLIQATF